MKILALRVMDNQTLLFYLKKKRPEKLPVGNANLTSSFIEERVKTVYQCLLFLFLYRRKLRSEINEKRK